MDGGYCLKRSNTRKKAFPSRGCPRPVSGWQQAASSRGSFQRNTRKNQVPRGLITDTWFQCPARIFYENALASAFPVACCGECERATIKCNKYLTFRRFPAASCRELQLLSRDHEDGRATGHPQGMTPEDARKDGHIRGRSK